MKYLLIILSLLMSNLTYANSVHNNDTYINNVHANTVYNSKGVALAIAMSNHHFSMGTRELQAGVAVGSFNGADALSVALGKKIYKDVLINFSLGSEGGKVGVGAGITFRF